MSRTDNGIAHDHAQIIAVAGLILYPELIPYTITRGAGMIFTPPLDRLADDLCDGNTDTLDLLSDEMLGEIFAAISLLNRVDDGEGWTRSLIDQLAREAAARTLAATYQWAARKLRDNPSTTTTTIAQVNAAVSAVTP